MSTTIPETETPRLIPVEVEEAVKRGAELLDVKHPGWADKIDTERLSMPDGCRCIIGQLYGSYWELGKVVEGSGRPYGFFASSFLSSSAWGDLTSAWLAEIMERRSA